MMRWMLSLVAIAALSDRAYSSEYKLLDVDRVFLEYEKLDPNNRDPYAPDYTGRWGNRTALQWDISSFNILYWNNNVHTESTENGPVKTVGWKWEAGLHLWKLDLYYSHHSRHIMDEPPQRDYQYPETGTQFPLENTYGIRIKLYEKQ